jgi:hypothetical protein
MTPTLSGFAPLLAGLGLRVHVSIAGAGRSVECLHTGEGGRGDGAASQGVTFPTHADERAVTASLRGGLGGLGEDATGANSTAQPAGFLEPAEHRPDPTDAGRVHTSSIPGWPHDWSKWVGADHRVHHRVFRLRGRWPA